MLKYNYFRRLTSLKLMILVGLSQAGWIRPDVPTVAKPAEDSPELLDTVVISVNGNRRIVKNRQELTVVRGDTIEVVAANLKGTGASEIGRVNLLGYGNRGGKIGEDRGYQVRTDTDLISRWSENKNGSVYAIAVETGTTLHGAVYLKMIEPQLQYAVVQVNEVEKVLRADQEFKVSAEDKVKVDNVVTNLQDSDHVTFQIVALQPANVLELPEPKPGEVRKFEIRFLRYGRLFAKIPMLVQN